MHSILFLGQKPIGEHCFDILLEHCPPLNVAAAVSNGSPDAVWWKSARVRERAGASGMAFIDNRERNEDAIVELVRDHAIDTIISVQHSWILPARILDAVKGRAFNLHNAKLPDYKGYNACNHALLNRDKTFTSTIHWMVPQVDAGSLAFEETFPIEEDETAFSLYRKAEQAGIRAFGRLVKSLAAKQEIPATPMLGSGTFHARSSIDELRRIANPADPDEVSLKARAFHFPPFEPAYVLEGGRKRYVTPDHIQSGNTP